MGQAKLRGTPEQRIAQGILKREALEEAKAQKRALDAKLQRDIFDALPPAEKKRVKEFRHVMNLTVALASSALLHPGSR
jgi:hypothetical protein